MKAKKAGTKPLYDGFCTGFYDHAWSVHFATKINKVKEKRL